MSGASPRLQRGLAALLLLLSSAFAQDAMLDPRVFEIGRLLRCPTCVSESVSESSSAIAQDMRLLIQEQLDAGASRAEILAFFQARYGDWILLEPPRRGVLLWVWIAPIVAAAAAIVLLLLSMRRWRRAAERVAPVLPEDVERVRAALAQHAPDETPSPARR
jgi:cytochrome c-type biogenesis protein CcmH